MSFAEELYEIYRDRPGNALISPYSIAMALHMAREGAKGATLEQMNEVLGERPELIDSEKLAVANAIWLRCQIKEDWENIITHEYRGETRDIRKLSNPERVINAWASANTNGKIPTILNEGQLTPEDKIVITNAIYFKDLWLHQFKESNTKKEPFFTSPLETVDVDLMYIREDFLYGETEDLQILEMFYENRDISMVILLPKTKAGKVKSIDYKNSRPRRREVIVYIPKLLMRKTYSLNKVLIGMGMEIPFTDLADFSGMTTDTPEGGVKIGDVIHKTFVDINEEGTEAAAVTGVTMMTLSMVAPMPVPVTFRADHPYVFLLKHVPTNTILFIGKVDNPL